MYLLVFVTLIVAIIGIYAETLSVQAARLYSGQTTLSNTMLAWHATAVAQAKFGVTTATPGYPGAAGCSLTNTPPAGVNPCMNGGNAVTVDGATTLASCSTAFTINCWTSLPQGYNTNTYPFYSIFYQPAAGQNYVITFVAPPTISAVNPAPGYITLSTGTQIGATMSDLFQQIKNNNNIAAMSYGMVVTIGAQNLLVTSTLSNGATATSFNYTLPTAGVPVNAIAIISSL